MKAFSHTVLILSIGLIAASCQSPQPVEVVFVDAEFSNTLPERDSAQLAYELSQKTWCSNNDAFSMVILLMDGEDKYHNFDERIVALDVKGIANAAWDIDADKPVTKGTLAYMLCRAMDIKGGLMMRLFDSRRYSYREAVSQGLMLKGSESEPLTGPEVVGIMGRAARMKNAQ